MRPTSASPSGARRHRPVLSSAQLEKRFDLLAIALEAIQEQLPMYGSIGRGKGQKQSHSTEAADVAQQLADGHGVAVRQGEFCAHPYCHRLLGIPDAEIAAGMHTAGFTPPAMVRISFGMYNDETEVDAFLEVMAAIAS